MSSPHRLNRRVSREAKLALRDVGKVLGRPQNVPGAIQDELAKHAAALSVARKERDVTVMRTQLRKVDHILEEKVSIPRKSGGRESIESIVVAICIALCLRAGVVEAFKIPSGSMIPTLEIGDYIFVNKFIYGVRIPWTNIKIGSVRKPEPGEVIVFVNPCEPEKDYIKRVVASENDTVEVRCNTVFVNGQMYKDDLLNGETCEYWDRDPGNAEGASCTFSDDSGHWDTVPTPCSHYREHGKRDYETYHEYERPEGGVHDRVEKDFPPRSKDLHQNADDQRRLFPSSDYPEWALPECKPNSDPRTMEQRVLSQGKIAPSTKEAQTYASLGECAPVMHYVVPPGHVFVMGDNRANSLDSRFWGSVPLENIKGKAIFVWWSSKPKAQGGLAWKRIGKWVHQ